MFSWKTVYVSFVKRINLLSGRLTRKFIFYTGIAVGAGIKCTQFTTVNETRTRKYKTNIVLLSTAHTYKRFNIKKLNLYYITENFIVHLKCTAFLFFVYSYIIPTVHHRFYSFNMFFHRFFRNIKTPLPVDRNNR